MEVRDGFIVGVFNYCDRWCEACPFTSRCRVFADVAVYEAGRDPGFRELAVHQERAEGRHEVPEWLATIVDEAEAALARGEIDDVEPTPALAHMRLSERATQYTYAVFDWVRSRPAAGSGGPSDPLAVVIHDSTLISSKVARAVSGLALVKEYEDVHDRDDPADHDGSAKVALLAMERSRDAWVALIQRGVVESDAGRGRIEELTWLIAALDRHFPQARGFVRPGFDEPEARLGGPCQ